MELLQSQLTAAFVISLLHGFIPSHWLPLIALSNNGNWSIFTTLRYALIAATVHSLGTVVIGAIIFYTAHLSFIGSLANDLPGVNIGPQLPFDIPFEKLSAVILFILGLVFLYRHYKHKHFHLSPKSGSKFIFGSIMLAMFLSPCMEIEGYFFAIAPLGWDAFTMLSLVYVLTTQFSIAIGVLLFRTGMKKFNAHKWEHNSGIVSSGLLLLSSLFMWFG